MSLTEQIQPQPSRWFGFPSSSSAFLHALVGRLLGLLLLAAAGLKAYGLGLESVSLDGILAARWFQVGVIVFEVFLALWLLSGKQSVGSWLISVFVVSAFIVFNLRAGWIGRASCGCFGQLSVSPWYAFGIDSVILFILIVARPPLKPFFAKPSRVLRTIAPAAFILAGGIALYGIFGGTAYLLYGSPEAALARLRGERISIYPRLVDVGAGSSGEYREAVIEVVNRTEHPIRLFGGTAN